MSSMSVSLASAFVPCAEVAYAVVAVAAAVPNVGLPDSHCMLHWLLQLTSHLVV